MSSRISDPRTSPRNPNPEEDRRLPLITLSDSVHFPRTRIRLNVHEPRYRRLVRDLLSLEEASRLVGLVLAKPGQGARGEGRSPRAPAAGRSRHRGVTRDIFPGGTAARLVEAEVQSDGRSTVVLEGTFRFIIRREVDGTPYRQALVKRVEEPGYDDGDAGIRAVRRQILDTLRALMAEVPGDFGLDEEALEGLRAAPSFEELVNSLATELELSALDKLELLAASLPDRALDLLSRLESQKQSLDLLRPFRPLASKPELN